MKLISVSLVMPAALVAVVVQFAVLSQSALAADTAVRKDAGASINLSNDDDAAPSGAKPIAKPVPKPVAKTAAAGASAALPAKRASGAAAAKDGKPPKPTPQELHRDSMLKQSTPENYMNSNTAVSRRYLKVDRETYRARMAQ